MEIAPATSLANALAYREQLHDKWISEVSQPFRYSLSERLDLMFPDERCQLFLLGEERGDVWRVVEHSGSVVLSFAGSEETEASWLDVSSEHELRSVFAEEQLPWSDPQGLRSITLYSSKPVVPVGLLRLTSRKSGTRYLEPADCNSVILAELGDYVGSLRKHLGLWREIHQTDRKILQLDAEEAALRKSYLRAFGPLTERSCGGLLYHRFRQKVYPPFIDPAVPERMRMTWDTDSDDVFICTHQKVGTHLAKKFALSLVRELSPLPADSIYASNDIGHGTIPWPEVIYSQHGRGAFEQHIARTCGYPRLWYTHAAVEDFPARSIGRGSKFIIVVRDPKSALVSQYYFWKRHPMLAMPESLTIEDFAELFLEGDLYFGDYHKHVLNWLDFAMKSGEGTAFVTSYEDMVLNKEETMSRLAGFIAPGSRLEPSRCRELCRQTEFDAMREDISQNPRSFHFNPKVFFRSGKIDDWMSQIPATLAQRIDEKTEAYWGGSQHALGILKPYLR